MKKTLALVLAFVMALSCTAALAEEEEITIGILATLTGYPLNGEHMVKGTQLAADEINAAGGVLGKVIASSDMVNFIKANAEIFESIGIFFPFLLAAILKSAQGSSTVAITTTAGIVAPLLPVLGLDSPALSCLTVIAIGAGAMTVSHANDSYFWVVSQFSDMKPSDAYRCQTGMTAVMGITMIVIIYIASLFLV